MKSYNEMAESVLERRDNYVIERRIQMKKITAIISCLCLCTIIGIGIWQSGILDAAPAPSGEKAPESITQQTDKVTDETAPAENYVYKVDEGQFSAYIGGKVIAEDKTGDKIADVSLTAGWKYANDSKWLSQEKLRGEIYAIKGIENDVAVALKFIDKGEALTTTHYYVIMNPDADLSAVKEYRISSITASTPSHSTSSGDEPPIITAITSNSHNEMLEE